MSYFRQITMHLRAHVPLTAKFDTKFEFRKPWIYCLFGVYSRVWIDHVAFILLCLHLQPCACMFVLLFCVCAVYCGCHAQFPNMSGHNTVDMPKISGAKVSRFPWHVRAYRCMSQRCHVQELLCTVHDSCVSCNHVPGNVKHNVSSTCSRVQILV